ncbi:MAG: hypothetical protein AAGC63_14675, partial [Propionicimonas sp.]
MITVGALSFIAFLPRSPLTSEFPFISLQWLFDPFAAVALRNLAVSDSAFGRRPPSSLSPVQVVQQAVATVGRGALWTLDSAPNAVAIVIGVAVLAVVGVMALRRGESEPEDAQGARQLVALFAVAQIGVMAVARASAEIDDLNDRLLAPATVLVLLGVICVVGDLSLTRWRAVRIASVAALVLWCAVGVGAVARGALQDNDDGYLGVRWDLVRAAAALDQIPPECRAMTIRQITDGDGTNFPSCGVVANDPWGWFGSELQPLMSPRRNSDAGGGPSDVEHL